MRYRERGFLAGVLLALSPATAALAAPAYPINLPAQPLGPSLYAVSRTTGIQLVFTDRALLNLPARPVSGRMTARRMFARLLDGTGYGFRFTNANTVYVFRKPERTGTPAAATPQPDPASRPMVVPAPTPPPPVPDIVVTGSRIRSDSFESPVPVARLGRIDVEQSGYLDLGEMLADQPGLALVDGNVGQPIGSTQNSGTSVVNLRNLGSNRALVLIDGRRTVSNAANRNVVSLNTIPTDLIERVDIITGAASAIYGSDAIAGVINIITESDLQGLRVKGRLGTSLMAGGGAGEASLSGSFGHRFAEGRGYVLVSASHERDDGLFARDRLPRAGRPWTYSPITGVIEEPDFSSDIPGGRFLGNAFYFDPNGLRTGFEVDRDGYNDRPLDILRTPRRTTAIAGKASFALSDAAKAFVHAQFSDLDTVYSRAPIGIRDTTTATPRDPETGLPLPGGEPFIVGRIDRSNPFVPSAIAAEAPARGIDFRRRMVEVGNRETDNDRGTLRLWTGLEGRIGSDWTYQLTYGLGIFDQHQQRRNGINLADLKNALDADVDPGTGVIRCRDALARVAGCVPINLFGVGSIDEAAAAYIRTNSIFRSRLEQQVLQGYVAGSALIMPAWPASMVAGFEYRRESGRLTTDAETRTGLTTNTGVPGFDDSYDVAEAFMEATLPLLNDRPWVRALSLDLAARIADYSHANVGTVSSYRAGLSWEPIAGIRLRGHYGTAQRAPDLAELYSPPRDDSDTITDICNGVTATTDGPIAANCRREPGIAAEIERRGVFVRDVMVVSSPNAGNLELKEETGRTLTFGLAATPQPIPGLSLSIDYYRITVDDAIDAFSTAVIMRQCYGSADFPDNNFCRLISRDPGSGDIRRILQRQENLNDILTSGIDIRVAYALDLDRLRLAGRLEGRIDWNHIFVNRVTFPGLNGIERDDDRGEADAPADVAVARLRYAAGPMSLQWRTRYVGPVVASNERMNMAVPPPGNPFYDRFPAHWRHDVSASLQPRTDVRLYAGVNNIFANAGPSVPEGATADATNGYIPQYGIVGRTGYVGVEFRF